MPDPWDEAVDTLIYWAWAIKGPWGEGGITDELPYQRLRVCPKCETVVYTLADECPFCLGEL